MNVQELKKQILSSVPFLPGKKLMIDFKTAFELYGSMELLSILNFLLEPSDENCLLVVEARLHDERMKYWGKGIPQEEWPEALRSESWSPGFLPFKALEKIEPIEDENPK